MGKYLRVGSVPPEANSEGGLNETVSEEVRRPEPVDIENLDDGPKIEEKTYRPAKYRLRSGDGQTIREDH